MHMYSLRVSKCALSVRELELRKTDLSPIVRSAELQPQRVPVVKVRALIGNLGSCNLGWRCGGGPYWGSEPSDSEWLIPPEEVVLLPSAEDVSQPPPPEESSTPLFAKPAVTIPEGDSRQDSVDVPQGPPMVSRPIARLKAKQAPRWEIERLVHDIPLNESTDSFK